MGEGMVRLYEAGDLIEAHLLQARLRDAGIEAFIENEATSTAAFPGIGEALGTSPALLVPEGRLEAAQEILEAFIEEAEAGEEEAEEDEEGEEEEGFDDSPGEGEDEI